MHILKSSSISNGIKSSIVFFVILIVVHASAAYPQPYATSSRANRDDLIRYFTSISGRFTLSGQHNREPNSEPLKWTNIARDITGIFPGLWGGDFLFLPDDVGSRQIMIAEAIRQWHAGSVVALTWHVCPPTVGETCDWNSDGVLAQLSDTQWTELMTDGSPLNTRWKARLDTILPFLQQLQTAGVVPLWRPIHEINEGWSWWGGRGGSEGSSKLFRITYDHLVHTRGLTNMVWVWCVKDVQMERINDFWPGDDYVDIASLDIWMNVQPSDDHYNKMLEVSRGKPIALGETGAVPSPSVLARQNRWVWFMVWAEYLKDPAFNTDDSVKETYYLNNVLSQDDIDLEGPGDDDNIAIGRPVFASSVQNPSFVAENANDGSLDTRWSSVFSEEQWIYVDLQEVKAVNRVTLHWDAKYAGGFQIQTSVDNDSWTTVYENYDGVGGVNEINLSGGVSTRYVKVYMFDRAPELTEFGYSIREFEIY